MAQESSMFRVHQTIRRVLCCKCGIPIVPNVANMCIKCLSSEVDITEGLQRQATLLHCPECDRYLQPPKAWIQTHLELIQLLTLCLMMLKNLNKVRLIHVEFIWTEPHSKRIRSSWGFRKKSWMEQFLSRFTLLNTFRKNTCVSLVVEPKPILTNGWLLCKSGYTFLIGKLCFIRSSSSSGMMLQVVPLKLSNWIMVLISSLLIWVMGRILWSLFTKWFQAGVLPPSHALDLICSKNFMMLMDSCLEGHFTNNFQNSNFFQN